MMFRDCYEIVIELLRGSYGIVLILWSSRSMGMPPTSCHKNLPESPDSATRDYEESEELYDIRMGVSQVMGYPSGWLVYSGESCERG